ncbi:HD domain-containing protein [Candidatus Peregrinibacteria bacterium]|nr:HD domain-containing protein [Candidatus Peregrinibacteria bacterium]
MSLDQNRSSEQNEINEETASAKLFELGLDSNTENVATVIKLMKCAQHPQGYEDILKTLNNPDALKAAMQAKGIKSIVHSEGQTLWDHTELSIKLIDAMNLSPEDKKKLKLIMLYHDLGKTEVWNNEKNTEATAKKLKKGELHLSMIGHAEAQTDAIKKGFESNGVKGRDLDVSMTVVLNHMKTSLLEQDPKKTVSLVDTFGANEEERKQTLRLLCAALEADGNSTEHLDLKEDGSLVASKNEKKLEINFDAVWAKYEEGLKLINAQKEQEGKKAAEGNIEQELFGMKLSDYLIKVRGVKPGPDMGKATKTIKGLLAANKDMPKDKLKELIDGTELA